MGGEHATAAFAGGAVVAFGPGLVPDGQVTLAITDVPRPARRITVSAMEVTTGAYTGEPLPSFVISRQTAAKFALPGLAVPTDQSWSASSLSSPAAPPPRQPTSPRAARRGSPGLAAAVNLARSAALSIGDRSDGWAVATI
jgi:hypothetical protein